MHCGSSFFSQGSLRSDIKYGEPKCRQFCIKCGCCRDVYLDRGKLAFHLDQPGVNRRPPATSPSNYLTAAGNVTVTSTTSTITQAAALPPFRSLPSGIRPPVRDLGLSAPTQRSMPLVLGTSDEPPPDLDWQGLVNQWFPPENQDKAMSVGTSSLNQYELISPAASIPPARFTTGMGISTTPRRVMAPTKPQLQAKPPSPDSTDQEPDTLSAGTSSLRKLQRHPAHGEQPRPRPRATAPGHRALVQSPLQLGHSGSTSPRTIYTG